MKRFGVWVLAVLLAVSSGYAQKISIKFGGGWGYASGGDFSSGLLGMTKYMRDEFAGMSGGFSAPQSGLSLSGEIIYTFKKNMAVALGIGHFGMSKEGTAVYSFYGMSAEERLHPKFDVIPVTLDFHYFVPFSKALRLDLSIGVGGYLTKLDWNFQTDFLVRLPEDPDQIYSGSDVLVFESRRALGLGLQGGAGFEISFSPRLSLCLNLTGRFASVSGFNGSWTEVGTGDFWDFSDNGTDARIWSYDWSSGANTYSQLVVQKDSPTGTTVSNARQARLGLSGFSAAIGIKIGLGR